MRDELRVLLPGRRKAVLSDAMAMPDRASFAAFDQPITSYEGACAYLDSFINYERTGFRHGFAEAVRFNTLEALLEVLGQPQDSCPTVHIAGTKGKGAVAAMIESALREAGYSTGLYTSPHLVTVRERIRINGEKVTPPQLTPLTERLRQAVVALDGREGLRRPTFFEVYTALAFMAFAEAAVEVAVIETGLGGRLDATNLITPMVTVITSIDLDHTEVLGETLAEIAREKAGIIKPGVPLVSARQTPEVHTILLAAAERHAAPFIDPPPIAGFGEAQPLARPASPEASVRPQQRFALALDSGPLWVNSPLLGRHQAQNSAVAYAALAVLAEAGFAVSDDDFAAALAKLRWLARFQVVKPRPWLVLDCAHNPASMRALVATLQSWLEYDKLTLVVGISADKDAAGMTRILCPAVDRIIVTAANLPRALSVDELLPVVQEHCEVPAQAAPTVPEAIEVARQVTTEQDAICITGSFFVVGEAMKYLGVEP